MGNADDGSFRNLREVDQGALDFHCADPVARDVHDVVHAAEEPEVAVLVPLRTISREVDPGNFEKYPFTNRSRFPQIPRSIPGQGLRNDQEPAALFHFLSAVIEDACIDSRERHRGGAGFRARQSRKR